MQPCKHRRRAGGGSEVGFGAGARRKSGGHGSTSASEGAAQIIFGRRMAARKARAALPQDRFHLIDSEARQQQMFGDPKVGNAPIGMKKTLRDAQALQPSLIDGGSAGDSQGGNDGSSGYRPRVRPRWPRRGKRQRVPSRLQQPLAVRGQARRSVQEFHPRSQSG